MSDKCGLTSTAHPAQHPIFAANPVLCFVVSIASRVKGACQGLFDDQPIIGMNALIPDLVIDRGTGLQTPDFSKTMVPVKISVVAVSLKKKKFCQHHCQAQ